ncbi:MAG: hypothetical protein LBM99_06165 [Bacillales bacterium]|jgi:N utilization substance protein A|nr:hypothetical protein [Bacillales bacterium]
MATRKKQKELGSFFDYLRLVSKDEKVDYERTLGIAKEAFESAYRKVNELGNEVVANIDEENDSITFDCSYLVMEDDDFGDDAKEFPLSEVLEIDPSLKAGDYYHEYHNLNEYTKSDIFSRQFEIIFQQRLKEIKKDVLLDKYRNIVGTVIRGKVIRVEYQDYEKPEGRFEKRIKFVEIRIDDTTANLRGIQCLPSDKFHEGEEISVFVKGFSGSAKSFSLFDISRTDPDFVRYYFNDIIPEVKTGKVIIKAISRVPDVLTKVAVYSDDPYIDPYVACIGVNSERVKSIQKRLIHGGDTNKEEKIQVIRWKENIEEFFFEALQPASILGINIDYLNKIPSVQVYNNESFVYGSKKSNVKTAKELLGFGDDWADIQVFDSAKTSTQIQFKTLEQVKTEASKVRKTNEIVEEDIPNLSEFLNVEETIVEEEVEVIEPVVVEEEKPIIEVKEEVIVQPKVEGPNIYEPINNRPGRSEEEVNAELARLKAEKETRKKEEEERKAKKIAEDNARRQAAAEVLARKKAEEEENIVDEEEALEDIEEEEIEEDEYEELYE